MASDATDVDGTFNLGIVDLSALTVHLADAGVGGEIVVVDVGGSTATIYTPGAGDSIDVCTIEAATGLPVAATSPGPQTIAAGRSHTCAVATGGTVFCWGDNAGGQLGNGTADQSSVPVAVTGITDAVAISGGYGHTCALRAGGTVSCWGWNWYGQFGNGAAAWVPTPVTIMGL